MSFTVSTQTQNDPRLTFAQKYIYSLLEAHGDSPISQNEIVATVNQTSTTTVRRSIAGLIELGYLEVVEPYARSGGRIRGNRYRTLRNHDDAEPGEDRVA